ncbi:MAG: 30S ribosomal protein S8 [Patescibacteria group bacterium]|nr:30S ribosomal protein S8 [Patescibacteria group bacterium]MCX7589889.1 30S ribosomal protein S8 [Patescibacteria group bacterium]MDW8279570.1 30S ribosomal protein S8 [bacterium]
MYWDILAKIKNAYLAKKEKVLTPFSKFDFEILKILTEKGYIKSVDKKTIDKKLFLEIKLLYNNKKPAMSNFKLISKPSRHIFKKYTELKPVKNGFGIGLVSTSKGVMVEKDAIKKRVGGEYLFEIW